jgi:hypothetical protein
VSVRRDGAGGGGAWVENPAGGEDPVDDVALGGVDEADDLHASAAAGAGEGIDLPDAIDQASPAAAGFAGRGCLRCISLGGAAADRRCCLAGASAVSTLRLSRLGCVAATCALRVV